MGQTLYPNSHPRAYYYNGKTYVVWQGGDGQDPYIDCYDHASQIWSGAVKIADNPISPDSHGMPAVIVDNSGYIHVFFGCHDTACKYSKSDDPEDISDWTAQSDIGSYCTYPQVIKDNSGNLHLFLREKVSEGDNTRHEYERVSTDFSSRTVRISATAAPVGNIYVAGTDYDSTNNRVHFLWKHYDATNGSVGMYHAYLNLGNGTMYAMDGTNLGGDVSDAEAQSYCGCGTGTHGLEIHLDSDNYPHVLFFNNTGSYYTYYNKWTGAAWSGAETLGSGWWEGGDFYMNSTSDIDAYITDYSGNLVQYHRDGSSWSSVGTIYSAGGGVTYGGATVVTGGISSLLWMVAQLDDDDFTNYDLNLYALTTTTAQGIGRTVDFDRSPTPGLTLAASLTRNVVYATRGIASALSLTAALDRLSKAYRGTESLLDLTAALVMGTVQAMIINVALSVSAGLTRTVDYARASVSNLSFNALLTLITGAFFTIATNLSVAAGTVAKALTFNRVTQSAISLRATIATAGQYYLKITVTRLSLAASTSRQWVGSRATSSSLSLA